MHTQTTTPPPIKRKPVQSEAYPPTRPCEMCMICQCVCSLALRLFSPRKERNGHISENKKRPWSNLSPETHSLNIFHETTVLKAKLCGGGDGNFQNSLGFISMARAPPKRLDLGDYLSICQRQRKSRIQHRGEIHFL